LFHHDDRLPATIPRTFHLNPDLCERVRTMAEGYLGERLTPLRTE
jgi:hypothetical protein